MPNKLKPCVCGSTLVDVEQFCGGQYRAYCFYCGKVGPECSTKEEAIEAWLGKVIEHCPYDSGVVIAGNIHENPEMLEAHNGNN